MASHCTDEICLRQKRFEPGNEGRVKSVHYCVFNYSYFIADKLHTPGAVDFSEKNVKSKQEKRSFDEEPRELRLVVW